MKIRIRKEKGKWHTYFVYNYALEDEFEVFMDKYATLEEAHSIAMYVAGSDI